jgi:hypothetical protein
VMAFLLSYITLYILSGFRLAKRRAPPNQVLFYFHMVLNPLLGFFNSLVYFRPRYIIYRERNPSETRINALCNVFNIDLDETVTTKILRKTSSAFSVKSVLESLRFTWRNSTGSGESSLEQDLLSPLHHESDESQDFPTFA